MALGAIGAMGAMGGIVLTASPAYAQAEPQAPPQAQRRASVPDVRPPAGAHLIPYVGVSSFAGSSGKGLGPGLRAGAIGGGHVNPMFSVNGEITMDLLNPSNASGDYTGINLDLALSPFVHVPLQNFELVFGPKLGAWFGAVNTSVSVANVSIATRDRSHGWLAGLNAGGFMSLTKSVELGGLLSFVLRNPTNNCLESNAAPGAEQCTSSGLNSGKVLALTVALLF